MGEPTDLIIQNVERQFDRQGDKIKIKIDGAKDAQKLVTLELC